MCGMMIMKRARLCSRRLQLSGSCHVDAWAGLKICVCVCAQEMCCALHGQLARSLADCHHVAHLDCLCCFQRTLSLYKPCCGNLASTVHSTSVSLHGLTPTLEQTFHGCKFYLYRLGLSLTIALAAMVLGKRPNVRKMLAAGMPRVLVLVLFLLAYHRADQRAAWLQHRVELSIDRTIECVSCDFLLTSQGGCADGRKACTSHGHLCWGPGAKILKCCAMCCFMLMAPHMLDASCFVLSGSGF